MAWAVVTVAAGPLAPSAAGLGTPPFAVRVVPASGQVLTYFQLLARPGAPTVAGQLSLFNRGRAAVDVLLDPVDALTAVTLGSAYVVRGLPTHGPTLWTRLSTRRLTLPPMSSRSVGVTVLVPAGTPPGQYLSGIGMQAANAGSSQALRSNLSVSSIARYAIGVEVSLAGPSRPKIALTNASLERRPAGLAFILDGNNPAT
jgi:hypothetical protein